MSKRQRHLYYACNFFVFAALAMVNTITIPYMKEIGYSLMQQSVILAANALIAILGQFLFGYLCDRFHAIKRLFLMAYILFIAGTCVMLMQGKKRFWIHLLSIALSGGLVKVVTGLNETWMLQADAQHYGRLRAAGALGLSAGSPIAGYISAQLSYGAMMWGFLAVSAMAILMLLRCKDVRLKKSADLKHDLKQLLCNRDYLLLVIIFLLIYMAGTADQYTVVDKLLHIGGSAREVGWKWGIQSFCHLHRTEVYGLRAHSHPEIRSLHGIGQMQVGAGSLLGSDGDGLAVCSIVAPGSGFHGKGTALSGFQSSDARTEPAVVALPVEYPIGAIVRQFQNE